MKYLLPILCLFILSCASLQRKIYNINKEYNQREKQENNFIDPECPSGAYYELCGSGCGLPHCDSPNFEGIRYCPSVCVEGCVCTGGKLLDRKINECVYKEDCSHE